MFMRYKLLPLLIMAACLAVSCDNKTANGELLMDKLKADREYEERPWQDKVADKYRPSKYYYYGRAYTGKVAGITRKNKYTFKGEMKDGFASGTWQYFFSDGKVEQQGFYENGFVKGEWTKFHKNGKKRVVTYHSIKDEKPATDTVGIYYNTGELFWKLSNDTVKTFYKSGLIQSIATRTQPYYYVLYNDKGNAVIELKNSTKTTFTSNGQFSSRMYYLRGPLSGEGWKQLKQDELVYNSDTPDKYGDSVLFEFTPGSWNIKQMKVWGRK